MVRDARTTIMDLEVGAFAEKLDQWPKRHEGNSPVNFGLAVSRGFARAAGETAGPHLETPEDPPRYGKEQGS